MSKIKNKIKVAILCYYPSTKKITGGVERHILNLVKELSTYNDLEIHVVSISKGIDRDKTVSMGNFVLHQIRSFNLPMTITGPTFDTINIIKEVKRINPDIVHGQMIGAPYGFATSFLSKDFPTILTVHTIIAHTSKATHSIRGKIHDLIWSYLEKWEIKKIQYIIIVSPHLKRCLEKMGAKNISVIPNSIDLNRFDVADESVEGRVLFVGRLLPIKGIENLIKAMRHILNRKYDAHLHIVGPVDDADYFKYLNELVKKLGLIKRVKFTGGLCDEDLLNEYAKCSVFVLPSLEESQGLVLLEAMATGKPILATNVGGIPYIVKNNKTGFLVEYGSVEELAEKIMKLLKDKELRRKMGEEGKERAKLFSSEENAKRIYGVYQKILKDNL